MDNMKKILVLNTGGTFSKVYKPITGTLEVEKNNDQIKEIITLANIKNILIDGLIYKDSLYINNKDREILAQYISNLEFDKIIIIHGTDTIDRTAAFLDKNIKNKKIVLTGSMKPFSIEPVEAVSNLMTAYGFLQNCKTNNIYISMHGMVKKYNKIKKNKKLGEFECH